MELIIGLLWWFGIIAVLSFAVKFAFVLTKKSKTKQDLECHMANVNKVGYNESVSAVKALLLIRGHYLPKELRVAAENWVDEMEEKLKGK